MFAFALPTTSSISFTHYYTSAVYPSLPLICTTHRGILRDALKQHKRLSPSAQDANLSHIISLITEYLPYLLFLQKAIQLGNVRAISRSPELVTEWRSVVTASPRFTGSVRELPRRRGRGIQYEVFWILSTLAYASWLQARVLLKQHLIFPTSGIAGGTSNAQLIPQAINHLLTSSSIFNYLLALPAPPPALNGEKKDNIGSGLPIDISEHMLASLSEASLALATLLAVLKSDPYPTYLALTTSSATPSKSSNAQSKEYLYTPPAPPTGVKALLYSRICIAASEHVSKAQGAISPLLKDGEVKEEYTTFLECLKRVAKARGCRFLGIDAEATGRVGEGIGWIKLGKKILGDHSSFDTGKDDGKEKKSLSSRMEKLKLSSKNPGLPPIAPEKSSGDIPYQLDPFNLNSEKFTLNALDSKWTNLNNSVMFHIVTSPEILTSKIPGGREVHSLKEFIPPKLEPDSITKVFRSWSLDEDETELEMPKEELYWLDGNTVVDSSDDEREGTVTSGQDGKGVNMPGAFVGQSAYY